MRRWFLALPIQRKLVLAALVVSTSALIVAMAGLTLLDLWRFRQVASGELASLARIVAENTTAAVVFDDAEAATETLASVRVRPEVRRACVYLQSGAVLAGYARTRELTCPARLPEEAPAGVLVQRYPVRRNANVLGTVYIERDVPEVLSRVALTGLAAGAMLVLAAVLAYPLASWLHRWILAPVKQLADAARAVGRQPRYAMPPIETPPDEVGQLVTAFQDMVERLEHARADREALLEREREANRLKDEFLAALSHELRTPLNAMMGWVQILATTRVSDDVRNKALASLARNAQAQRRVVEDLLDVSRIATGTIHLRLAPTNACEVIADAIDLLLPIADRAGIALTAALPPGPCLLDADRDRLQQIVNNLLSNAIKFTPAGGRVSIALTADGAGRCEIAVVDSGIGIAPEFLPHVFERFRQADGSTTRPHGGLGLGLALVKELTELHGGSVTASSAGTGRGATFTLRFATVAPVEADAPPVVRETL